MKLKDKTCLIVGASSGMGRHTALHAGTQGATVIAAARRLDDCEAVAARIKQAGGQAWALPMDGTDPDSIAAGMAEIGQRFGKLDCVFNNLGSTFGFSPVHETPIDRWNQSIATNLTAPFLLMRQEIPLLLKAGGGVIVNNSSAAGVRGVKEMADYSAAKWGLIGLTQSAALEYAEQGVRVNVIAPGIIQTEKFGELKAQMPELFETLRQDIPSKAFGHMQDIANTVVWLMSDEARYINGATIRVDAGQTAG